ncbi:hypothetical protein ACFOGJ_07130 [Marinibaculum pumilum]|uniref:VCBS repeat-containing protein n=1 Tax=Marinibaculum pumilum TaxID=1766165 RepID=A0ABV7KXZ3_9PROT
MTARFLFPLLLSILAAAPAAGEAPACPGLAPVGQVAAHGGDRAWLADPRDSYRHGVFGEPAEPGVLVLQGPAAQARGMDCLVAVLPEDRVFEDREVRFWDADGDGTAELAVVETDLEGGARLALYGTADGELRRLAQGPALGFHRWLSPVGPVPWGRGGAPLLAVVTTPHIGGVLRLYRYTPGSADLTEAAQLPGWSTHRFGSALPNTALVDAVPGGTNWIVAPDQARRRIARLRWQDGAWSIEEVGETEAQVSGAIAVAPDGCAYRVPTDTGIVQFPRPGAPGGCPQDKSR